MKTRLAIAFLRSATHDDMSLQSQGIACCAFALGIRVIEEKRLPGVSGFSPLIDAAIDELVARRGASASPDLLVLANRTRLGRDMDAVMRRESQLRGAGYVLIYAEERGPIAEATRLDCHLHSAEDHAELTSALEEAGLQIFASEDQQSSLTGRQRLRARYADFERVGEIEIAGRLRVIQAASPLLDHATPSALAKMAVHHCGRGIRLHAVETSEFVVNGRPLLMRLDDDRLDLWTD